MNNVIYLIGYIGDAGTDGKDEEELCAPVESFIARLYELHQELNPSEYIWIYMSTEGGDTIIASAIQSTITSLRKLGRRINCHVMGFAFSSGFDILQACDFRTMEPFAALMTHQSKGGEMKDISDEAKAIEAGFSRALEKAQFEFTAKRTGLPVSFFQKKVKNNMNWYILASEAKKLGLVDQITHVPEFHKSLALLPKKRIKKVIKKDIDEERS